MSRRFDTRKKPSGTATQLLKGAVTGALIDLQTEFPADHINEWGWHPYGVWVRTTDLQIFVNHRKVFAGQHSSCSPFVLGNNSEVLVQIGNKFFSYPDGKLRYEHESECQRVISLPSGGVIVIGKDDKVVKVRVSRFVLPSRRAKILIPNKNQFLPDQKLLNADVIPDHKWGSCEVSSEGFITIDGNSMYVNGAFRRKLYVDMDHQSKSWWVWGDDILLGDDESLRLNGRELVYLGKYDDCFICGNKLVVKNGNYFIVISRIRGGFEQKMFPEGPMQFVVKDTAGHPNGVIFTSSKDEGKVTSFWILAVK